MILKMDNIQKHFSDCEVLHDISLHVDSGEVVSIIGPSGSGKSTLLRCATLLEKIDGGSIVYKDHNIAYTSDDKRLYMLRRRISPGPGIISVLSFRTSICSLIFRL